MRLARRACALASLALAACGKDAPPPMRAAASAHAAASAPSPRPVVPSVVPPAPSPSASSQAALAGSAAREPVREAGACRLLAAPVEVAPSGAPALWSAPDAAPSTPPRVLLNRAGAPVEGHLAAAPRPPPPAPKAGASASPLPARVALPNAPDAASALACAIAGRFAYCVDDSGAIRRAPVAGGAPEPIATARPGTPIAAAALGPEHAVVAFLRTKQTSEGAITGAFASLDAAPPVELSDEAAGASYVALAARADRAIAMYADARAAMTPVHARVLAASAGRLMAGKDGVLFVGDGSAHVLSGAVALGPSGPAFALLPIGRDVTSFGLAVAPIDEPAPRDDVPVVWSIYPNGLTPAPVAATVGVAPVRVVRARPANAKPGAPEELELGVLDENGAFHADCTIASAASFRAVAMLPDGAGGVWIAYTDEGGTFLERRGR